MSDTQYEYRVLVRIHDEDEGVTSTWHPGTTNRNYWGTWFTESGAKVARTFIENRHRRYHDSKIETKIQKRPIDTAWEDLG